MTDEEKAKRKPSDRFVEDGVGLTIIRDGKEYTPQQIIEMGKRERRERGDEPTDD